MDKICIKQLRVDAIIGIHEWEKRSTQPVYIDLDLSFDCRKAAHSDDIKDALDYYAVCQKITHFVRASRFELIERLAEEVAQLVLKEFACKKVKLKLFKPFAVANAQTVGIKISRSQSD